MEASREAVGNIQVFRLVGTAFEMGLQHGGLAAEMGVDFGSVDQDLSLLVEALPSLRQMGHVEEARESAYPDVYDECRGLGEEALRQGLEDFSEELCLLMAFWDVTGTRLGDSFGGCTQVVAAGAATSDGVMVHGRNMDSGTLSVLTTAYPALIVRRPEGRIPFVEVGVPGSVATHTGMNAEGLVVASNAAYTTEPLADAGRGKWQIMRQIVQDCKTVEEAEAYLANQERATDVSLMILDGRQAALFEMTPFHMAVRRLDSDGLLYVTNHYVHEDMREFNSSTNPQSSSRSRWARFEELLPGLHGRIDAAAVISVLRDTRNPLTGETHPADLVSGGGSIANNGALQSIVFVPEERTLYVALGAQPVPPRSFVGFSMDQLLQKEGAKPPEPPAYD